MIAQAVDERDVVAPVKFARTNKLKVTVGGGGYNWYNPFPRDNGLLIDITDLHGVLSITHVTEKLSCSPSSVTGRPKPN
jgi:FAD/FMN-containing dehydrogenase